MYSAKRHICLNFDCFLSCTLPFSSDTSSSRRNFSSPVRRRFFARLFSSERVTFSPSPILPFFRRVTAPFFDIITEAFPFASARSAFLKLSSIFSVYFSISSVFTFSCETLPSVREVSVCKTVFPPTVMSFPFALSRSPFSGEWNVTLFSEPKSALFLTRLANSAIFSLFIVIFCHHRQTCSF